MRRASTDYLDMPAVKTTWKPDCLAIPQEDFITCVNQPDPISKSSKFFLLSASEENNMAQGLVKWKLIN